MGIISRSSRIVVAGLRILCMALLASGCGLGKMARERQAAQGGPVELKLAYHLPVDLHLS